MRQTKLPNEFDFIAKFIKKTSKSLNENDIKFGYRERIQIERCLFLFLKNICKERLKYNLRGLSNYHIEQLRNYVENNNYNIIFVNIIEKAFQLNIYIKQLSCESAYVRGDSITKLNLNKKNIQKVIRSQLYGLVDMAKRESLGLTNEAIGVSYKK